MALASVIHVAIASIIYHRPCFHHPLLPNGHCLYHSLSPLLINYCLPPEFLRKNIEASNLATSALGAGGGSAKGARTSDPLFASDTFARESASLFMKVCMHTLGSYDPLSLCLVPEPSAMCNFRHVQLLRSMCICLFMTPFLPSLLPSFTAVALLHHCCHYSQVSVANGVNSTRLKLSLDSKKDEAIGSASARAPQFCPDKTHHPQYPVLSFKF